MHNVSKYRFHPWHGLSLGEMCPEIVNCYVEMVHTDTIKYELDKLTGLLKVDRPQKYSSLCPSLYGLLPQTFAGKQVADYCAQKTEREGLIGDGDPLDVCILTEHTIVHGDIIVRAIPIGGFRLLDGDQVDDKIISVMVDDLVYSNIREMHELAPGQIERLCHYFLTYKQAPGKDPSEVVITHIYGREEAQEVIRLGMLDYQTLISNVEM